MIRFCLIAMLSAAFASVAVTSVWAQNATIGQVDTIDPSCPMPLDGPRLSCNPQGQSGPMLFGNLITQNGECPECLGPAPIPETYGGWNLYWDDPCNPGMYALPLRCQNLQPSSCAPVFYLTADFIPLLRDQSHTQIFQTLGSTTNSVLDTDNFNPGFRAGVKATIGTAIGNWYRLETTFFGGYQWNDAVSVRDATLNGQGGLGSLRSPFSNFGNPAIVPGLDNNDFASIAYRSQLNSSELNLRRRLVMPPDRVVASEASFLIGVRYMNVSEAFSYLSHSNGTGADNIINQYNVATRNSMVGPQIGMLSQILLRPQTWIDLEAKGAILGNAASQQSTYLNNTNGVVGQFAGNASRDRNAFLGDFSINFNHQFTRTLTLRLGYNALVLNGLALGSQNVNHNLNVIQLGPSSVDTKGRITYSGPTLGLTWAF